MAGALGRQPHAVPGLQMHQTLPCRPVLRPLLRARLPAAQQLLGGRGASKCAHADSGGSHAAISIGTESSALPEPAAAHAPADGDGHSASRAAAGGAASSSSGGSSSSGAAAPAAAVAADGVAAGAATVAAAADGAAGAAGAAAAPAAKKKGSNFINRVIFGVLLGVGGAGIVAAGSLPYLCVAMFVVFHATQEFYGILTSAGLAQGTPPPSRFVSVATTALCLSITAFTYFSHGKSGAAMSVAAFCLLVMNVLSAQRPKFVQLASSVFGLVYCGYLPSFWIKLRNLDVAGPQLQLPGISNEVLSSLGAQLHLPPLTVGFVATLTTVACIIAADTGAYFVGKNLGRTKLTDISPKKTVEGAVGGLASAVAVALLFWRTFSWPGCALAAAGYGVLTFTSSLFGDLIESIMKRDAGIKDSGNLIPGHGGLLDRFDSYIFSGALGYFYITALLPRFGLPLA